MISKLTKSAISELAAELNSHSPRCSNTHEAIFHKSESDILIELNNLALIGASKAYRAGVS